MVLIMRIFVIFYFCLPVPLEFELWFPQDYLSLEVLVCKIDKKKLKKGIERSQVKRGKNKGLNINMYKRVKKGKKEKNL